MQFNAWPWFFLLLLIPIFHRWWMRRNQPAKVTFPLAIPKKVTRMSPVRFLLILRYVALVFFVAALARPQTPYKQTHRNVSGVDIVMIMDVSASMNIRDLGDESRLEMAKTTMKNFINGRENDRIGFVVFSGEPFTMAPPTLDYGLVLSSIKNVETGRLKDGTAIGDGLALGVSRLKESEAKSRVIILLTDGDNNLGQIDPLTAGDLAAGYGIKVYTIAIGREGKVKLPIKQKDVFGRTVTTYQIMENVLNPALLKKIARNTKGKFYRVTDAETLVSVFKEIDQLERTEQKTQEKIKYHDRFEGPLKLGALFLLLEQLLGLAWWRIIP